MNDRILLQQNVQQYLAMVHRRRALVVAVLGVSVLVAILYNSTTRPVYQATAQILIDRDAPSVLPTKELDVSNRAADYYETQYKLLEGRTLAAKVVERLGLQNNPELTTGAFISPWERLRRTLGAEPGAAVDRDGMPLSPAVASFRSRLTVEPVSGSRLVNLRFSAYDPNLASRAVNTLALLYIEQTLEFRYTASTEATSWLTERLKEQRAKVASAEQALQVYRERFGLVNLEERQSLVDQRLSSYASAANAARTDRIEKETLLKQMRALPALELQTFPLVAGGVAVQKLRARQAELLEHEARLTQTLGDLHPELVRLRSETKAVEAAIAAEVQNIVRGLEAEFQSAWQKEASLEANLEGAKKEAVELNRKILDLEALKRDAGSNRELYQKLMDRAKETGLESELKATNIRIVERADVPKSPIAPRSDRNLRFALLLGLALGVGLALLFEHFDNTLKTPEDVQEHLGLPFLGMVPDASQELAAAGPAAKRSPLFVADSQSMVAEAYRVLRTNLLFSAEKTSGRILAVTSANPGEGKTTTVANLAICLANNGSRVLVVEADLRRPALHQHFGTAPAPGLTDVIVGNCAIGEALVSTDHKGVKVLPCGYVPPNPTELLGSRSFKDILLSLRGQYDFVLIDTSPVLNLADAPVLCPLADGVVVVVGAEISGRPAIQRAIEQIVKVGGKLTGIVLNRVDLKRNAYYYNQYYGRYYQRYYTDTKPPSAPTPPPSS